MENDVIEADIEARYSQPLDRPEELRQGLGGDVEERRQGVPGDRERLAEQFEEHRSHVRAVGYRMLGSISEAEDAVQEA